MKDDPPMDARCRDKFLVQSVGITAEQDVGNITSIVSVPVPNVRPLLMALVAKH